MAKHGSLLYPFSIILMLAVSLPSEAADQEDRKTYIVYLGSLPKDQLFSPLSHHIGILESITESSSPSNLLVRSYKKSFNGFAAKLTDRERERLANMEGVVSVFLSTTYLLQTTRSWDFLGFSEKVKRNPTVESNVVVGVIDSGIWPESNSFSDEGFGPAPKQWKGVCKGGFNFTCNSKLIGARYYIDSTARDEVGHGTHTASTAAGNPVEPVSFYGLAQGIARGGVPSARIAAYKVCSSEGCSVDGILAAFDDAIADGVDIITISIASETAPPFHEDPIAIGAFHAMEKGILTSNSAGNYGPAERTVSSVAPWILSVAASSTDRRIIDKVVLGNGRTLVGSSVNTLELNGMSYPLIEGKDALRSGGCVDCEDGNILKSEVIKDLAAPTVASFSSRGPNNILPEIIKPDITAPGVEILAAFSPVASLTVSSEDLRHVKYCIQSGTSMSCPHVAGVAAYIKTFHPNWSPAAIKSSIMTTAGPVNNTSNSTGEFLYGSGHINPLKAVDPGLVYETSKDDYIKLLCSILDEASVRLISGADHPCSAKTGKKSPKDLNYPSMAGTVAPGTSSFSLKFRRTVKNVGLANSTYKANIISKSGVDIQVVPQVLSFKSLNEEKAFDVTVSGRGMPYGSHVSASLVWTDGTYSVRSPVLVFSL
ncbi:hypothetical protein EV1_039450 [Malus domestica]